MKIDERRTAEGARRRAGISHMPAASLSHYASLSFVVIGRRPNSGIGGLRNGRCGMWDVRLQTWEIKEHNA